MHKAIFLNSDKEFKELGMITFNEAFMESFLAVVRKYMQLRGGLTQKDLSEMTGVGISTMSRFFNLKTNTVDEQLVAHIMALLNIPLHEIIDGVHEDSTETFKKLVQFYREQKPALPTPNSYPDPSQNSSSERGGDQGGMQKTTASIHIGGKKQSIPFGEAPREAQREASNYSQQTKTTDMTMRDKLQTLSPRQKAYLTDFLDLEMADRDLVVDLGDAVFRYLKMKKIDF